MNISTELIRTTKASAPHVLAWCGSAMLSSESSETGSRISAAVADATTFS
jgi:hypothetical protein